MSEKKIIATSAANFAKVEKALATFPKQILDQIETAECNMLGSLIFKSWEHYFSENIFLPIGIKGLQVEDGYVVCWYEDYKFEVKIPAKKYNVKFIEIPLTNP